MNYKIGTITLITFIILPFTLQSAAAVVVGITHMAALFPHIETGKRRQHVAALEAINAGEKIPDSFLTTYGTGPDEEKYERECPHFCIEPKLLPDSQNQIPVPVPFWVAALHNKNGANWPAFKQIITAYPRCMSESYKGDPFCKIVAQAAPPLTILRKIRDLQIELPEGPFATRDEAGLFPNAYLSPQTSLRAKEFFLRETEDQVREQSGGTTIDGVDQSRATQIASIEHLYAYWLFRKSDCTPLTPPPAPVRILKILLDNDWCPGLSPYLCNLATSTTRGDLETICSDVLTHVLEKERDSTATAAVFLKAIIENYPDQSPENIYPLLTVLAKNVQSLPDETPAKAKTLHLLAKMSEQHCSSPHASKKRKI